jgi:hypothetical protein
MQQQSNTKGRVTLIALGGAGINNGIELEKQRNLNEKSFANLDIIYIDTSRSNLSNAIDPQYCYLIDGLDGSGKVRAENHEIIAQHIPVILQRFDMGDVVIVMHSLSGGSGSVAGPLMVSELLARGIPTIAMVIGSSDTKIEARNSLNTLKSYAAISDMRNMPLSIAYAENNHDDGRKKADAACIVNVLALCALFSRDNEEMDSKDLEHWLRFDKTTSFRPQVASLTLIEAGQTVPNLGNVISVATIAKRGDRTALANPPEYQTVGFLKEDSDPKLLKRAPLHFIISDGVLVTAMRALEAVVAKFEASGGIRQQQNTLLSKNDKPALTGLIL